MKKKLYEAQLPKQQSYTIYLNINQLNNGRYELKIVQKNRIIKRIYFNKKK